jgi:hypothetical protein
MVEQRDELLAETVERKAGHIVIISLYPFHKTSTNHFLYSISTSLVPTKITNDVFKSVSDQRTEKDKKKDKKKRRTLECP